MCVSHETFPKNAFVSTNRAPQRNNIKMATRMMIENSKINDVIVKASAFTSDPSKVRAAKKSYFQPKESMSAAKRAV